LISECYLLTGDELQVPTMEQFDFFDGSERRMEEGSGSLHHQGTKITKNHKEFTAHVL
jgi:hypothetical protein